MSRRRQTLSIIALVAALVLGLAPAASATVPSEEQWRADVRQAMAGGRAYLTERAADDRPGDGRLALNLDIDNSMLATEYDTGKAIAVVRRFTRHARSLGMAVLVNTARIVDKRAHTLVALRAAGYRIDGLCMREAGVRVAAGKQRCRREFVRDGYTLVANVGNRETDFLGGNYERAFRLPNYDNQLT
ncbi:unannotated protein [freshwater metagenome]|uniref:Unannotated protein n=1 Tax=freshwater metagenome TaxID=449393 RepID=A0A6J6QXL8_9ZZZZ